MPKTEQTLTIDQQPKRITPVSALSSDEQDAVRQIRGAAELPEPEDETAYFRVCPLCGQAGDRRSLYQVFYHEERGHKPQTEAERSETG